MTPEIAAQTPDSLKRLIETTQDAVVFIDSHGVITLFNLTACRIFGYKREEAIGQKVNMLMSTAHAQAHDGYISRYVETGETRAIGRIRIVEAKRKNGEVFPIELSVTEIGSEKHTQYAAFIRDISEKVRLQQRIIEGERMAAIGTTAATFAHEIGNPLNSMYMHGQLVERRLGELEQSEAANKVRSGLKTIMSELERLSMLLHEFRALARRQDLNARKIDLRHLFDQVIATESVRCEAHNIDVQVRLCPEEAQGSLRIEADETKLYQVFINLFKNAIEAMSAHASSGTLGIDARKDPENSKYVRIDVWDTGPGIPAGVEIFDPFVTTKDEGTGLGLAVCRQIVHSHHGSIDVLPQSSSSSQENERGTTFVIRLPLDQPTREELEAASE